MLSGSQQIGQLLFGSIDLFEVESVDCLICNDAPLSGTIEFGGLQISCQVSLLESSSNLPAASWSASYSQNLLNWARIVCLSCFSRIITFWTSQSIWFCSYFTSGASLSSWVIYWMTWILRRNSSFTRACGLGVWSCKIIISVTRRDIICCWLDAIDLTPSCIGGGSLLEVWAGVSK